MDGTKIKSNANINRELTFKETTKQLKEVEQKIITWKSSTAEYCVNINDQMDEDDPEQQKNVDEQDLVMGQAIDEITALMQLKNTLMRALEHARNDVADDAEYQYRKKIDQVNLEQMPNSDPNSTERTLSNQDENQTVSGKILNERTLPAIDPEKNYTDSSESKTKKNRLINLTDPSSRRCEGVEITFFKHMMSKRSLTLIIVI